MKLSAHGALLLATAVVLGLGACGGGGGDGTSLPSDRPTVDRTVTRTPDNSQETPTPTDDRTGRPTRTADAEPTLAPTTERPEPAPTTERAEPAPTTAQAEPAPTTAQAEPTRGQAAPQPPATVATTPPASNVATAAESTGAGDVGCLLLILLVGLMVGGLVVWRTRHGSDWDVEATTLVGITTDGLNRMPPVLITTTIAERALVWPPLRDDFGTLMGDWDVLGGRTADEERRAWAIEVRTRLQELVAAVDQENEVLAADREWRLLRPRLAAAEEALRATLRARPATGTPGSAQPAYAPATTGYPPDAAATGYPPDPADPAGTHSPIRTGYPSTNPRHGYPAEPPGPTATDYPPDPTGPTGPTGPDYPPDPPEPPDHARHRA